MRQGIKKDVQYAIANFNRYVDEKNIGESPEYEAGMRYVSDIASRVYDEEIAGEVISKLEKGDFNEVMAVVRDEEGSW